MQKNMQHLYQGSFKSFFVYAIAFLLLHSFVISQDKTTNRFERLPAGLVSHIRAKLLAILEIHSGRFETTINHGYCLATAGLFTLSLALFPSKKILGIKRDKILCDVFIWTAVTNSLTLDCNLLLLPYFLNKSVKCWPVLNKSVKCWPVLNKSVKCWPVLNFYFFALSSGFIETFCDALL